MKKIEKSKKLVLSALTVSRLQQNITAEQLANVSGAMKPSSIKPVESWVVQC